MKRCRHWLYAAVPPTAAFFSLWLLVQATWIPLKAELAQWLIERSWEKSQSGEADARPWPWADTHAEAILHVPGQQIRQVVLAGNSGRNLAFGPVFADGMENSRDLIISGHRDTHFRFLKGLSEGDLIRVETRETSRWFEVRYTDVVDSRLQQLVVDPGMDRLSLVTCFPFDGLAAGGPMRYVVTALPVNPASPNIAPVSRMTAQDG